MQIEGFENISWQNKSFILNPKETVHIMATMPKDVPILQEIEGFSIRLENGRKIRFGYEKLGWWDRLRWLVAEHIRPD